MIWISFLFCFTFDLQAYKVSQVYLQLGLRSRENEDPLVPLVSLEAVDLRALLAVKVFQVNQVNLGIQAWRVLPVSLARLAERETSALLVSLVGEAEMLSWNCPEH